MTKAEKQLAQLIALYRSADAVLQLLVNKALASGAAGTLRYRRQARVRVLRILKELEKRAVPLAGRVARESYVEGARAVSGRLEGFGKPDQDSVNILSENLTQRLKDGHATIGRQVDDVFRREALKAVAGRMATAGQAKDSAKQLVHALESQGVKAFTDKAGRAWSLEAYAAMAARTTARQAASQGTVNQMHRMDLDLVDVSSHPHKHDACSPYDGKTFSLSGKDHEFPKLDKMPPFHPNCRHVLKPSKHNFLRAEQAAA